MSTQLDLDDVAADNPLAKKELDALRDELHEAAMYVMQLQDANKRIAAAFQNKQADLAAAQKRVEDERKYSELLHKGNSHLRAIILQCEKVLLAIRDKPGNGSRNASDAAALLDSLNNNTNLISQDITK